MAGNFLLTVRDLAVEFDGEPTFYCPEFDVRTGDKVLLTGASGAGKSVFLKVLAGSLPASSVRSGHFIVGASQSMDYAEFARRRPLGDRTSFVFQDAMNSLHPYLPISRQLKVLGDFDTAGALQTMGFRQEKLDLLGKRIFRRPLSGGERQRLSLLFAAVPSRDFVLLDEPLTDIDIFSRREIEKLIDRDLLGAVAKTVILVTHDTEWLQPNVDRKQLRQFEIIAPEDGARSMSGAPVPLMLERRRKLISVRQPWSLAGADPQRAPWDKGPNNGVILSLSVRNKITVTRDGSTFAAWPFQTLDDGSEAISIRRGEGIALYGLSGCGKSVLLQCIAGLWSRKVLANLSRIGQTDTVQTPEGTALNNLSPAVLAHNIQYVFQNNRGAAPLHRTIAADLEELFRGAIKRTLSLISTYKPAAASGVDLSLAEMTKARARDALEKMVQEQWTYLRIPQNAFDDRKTRTLATMSLGMLRRYMLIRALIKLDAHTAWFSGRADDAFAGHADEVRFKPRLLLADEISRGLDTRSLERLTQLLTDLKSRIGLGIVVVSHEQRFVSSLAERIYLIVDGYVMPTPLRPSPSTAPREPAIVTQPGLLNGIYDVYCPSGDETVSGPTLRRPTPENCAKLDPGFVSGCPVHAILKDDGGCPGFSEDGANGCCDTAARELGQVRTCG